MEYIMQILKVVHQINYCRVSRNLFKVLLKNTYNCQIKVHLNS